MTPEEVEARFQRIEALLAQAAEQNAERDRREEDRDQHMDLMMIGINSLVESSIEYKQWKVETDQRFDILLQEIRASNQRVNILENNSSI